MSSYYMIDPRLYDDQFWWKRDDIEFWKHLLLTNKYNTLELAAGTGRLSLPLLREGSHYFGLELSNDYVKYANRKLSLANLSQSISVGDMSRFNLKRKFDFIFIGFNSFLHLLTNNQASECLTCVRQHMHDKSFFLIDIFVPHPLILYKPKSLRIKNFSFFDTQINKNVDIMESINYHENTEVMDIRWDYIVADIQQSYKIFDFKMKMFFPDTMHNLLYDNGFNINSIWGDYNFNKFSDDSNLQIYKCSKA